MASITSRRLPTGHLSKGEQDILIDKIKEIPITREKYILGEDVDNKDFLRGCVVLFCVADKAEAFLHRGDLLNSFNNCFNEDYFKDLLRLTAEIQSVKEFFIAKDKDTLEIAPEFGKSAGYLGGSYGDLVLDHTLIDFKTDKLCSYKGVYIHQLLGYYALSTEEKLISQRINEKPYNIRKIGLFYARYNRLITIDLQDLENAMQKNGYPLNLLVKDCLGVAEHHFISKMEKYKLSLKVGGEV